MLKPTISVVIPTLNEEKYLSKTLESLKSQTFKDFEIIISDGGSTDKTVSIAKQFSAKTIVTPDSNICLARDAGLEKAAGEIVVGADADTIYPPTHLQIIFEEFQKDKKAVAITGKAKMINGPRWGIAVWEIIYLIIKMVFNLTGFLLYAPAYNLSYRKESLIKVGGYNTNLEWGADELDVLRRLKKVGKTVFSNRLDPPLTEGRRYKVGFFVFLFKHIFYYYWFNYLTARIFGKSVIRAKPVR